MTSKMEREFEKQFMKRKADAFVTLWELQKWMEATTVTDTRIREIRIKKPTEESAEYLFIVKGKVDGKPSVGFHSAADLDTGLKGLKDRLENKDLKFREDRPYEPPGK